MISAQATVLPDGEITFTRQGRVDATFTPDFDIVNVVPLAPGKNSLCDPNDPGAQCYTDAVVHVTTPPTPPWPTPPPTVPGLPSTGCGGVPAPTKGAGGGASR